MNVKNNLKFFLLNISSLLYNFFKLHTLLATSEIPFDITDITESRLKSFSLDINDLKNLTLPNYDIEHCPTDSPKSGALFYIKEVIIYIKRRII